MTAETTQVLAEFSAALTYDKIPERVRDYCKDVLLDTLACAVAGHQGDETHQLAALSAGLAQSSESTVIGGDRLSLAGATMLNGYLITAVTMCDAHRPTLTHITPEVVPPALAIAERDGLSGRDLLVAIVAGSEITTRVGVGIDYPAFRARGWHGPGVFGPFGAAAAVGRLRRFDAETMARAFGLAGSQSAGTFAAWGTPTVKFHQCRGALSGLMAALLAEQKFVATREFLTARDGGLYNTYSNGGRAEAATADLGSRWELEQIALRLWPAASSIQGMMTALFDIIEQHKIDPARVKTLRIALSEPVFKLHGIFAQVQGEVRGAALRALRRRRDPARPRDDARPVRAGALRRSEAAALCRAGGGAAPIPHSAACRRPSRSITADGKTLSARCDHPRGSPENRLSRAQIESKFRTYARGRLSDGQIEDVIAAVVRLEELGSVRTLMDALRETPRRERAPIAAVGRG